MFALAAMAVLCADTAVASRQFQATTDTLTGAKMTMPTTGSVSFAVNPQFTANDGLYHIMFELRDPSSPASFTIMKYSDGSIGSSWFGTDAVPRPEAKQSANGLTPNAWAFVTVSWANGGALNVYLNGQPFASAQGMVWQDTSKWQLSIGNRYSGGYDARSRIALVGIWSRLLTAQEIALLAAGATPSLFPGSLLAEYDLTGASTAAQAGSGGTLAPQAGSTASIAAGDPAAYVAPVSTLFLDGPGSGVTGTSGWPSQPFTVMGRNLGNPVTVTPADGADGRFVPPTVTVSQADPLAIFQYLPGSPGTKSVSVANNSGLSNPKAVTYRVTTLAAITADALTQTVSRGSDAVFHVTTAAAAGQVPHLMLGFMPAGSSFQVNLNSCAAASAAQPTPAWSDCGAVASGTYTLTVHTAGVSPGAYAFNVFASVPGAPDGAGVTLALTVN